MRSATFKACVLALIAIFAKVCEPLPAQDKVLEPEYPLVSSTVFHLEPGEKNCHYFLWSKLGGTEQRVSFTYNTGKDNKTDGDFPKISYVKIFIQSAHKSPTAQVEKRDPDGLTHWILWMDTDTYQSEMGKGCLSDIKVIQKD